MSLDYIESVIGINFRLREKKVNFLFGNKEKCIILQSIFRKRKRYNSEYIKLQNRFCQQTDC